MVRGRLNTTVEPYDRAVAIPARAAATVVLLRDAAEGMEAFMVKRHGLSDVLGEAYVFPGGKVDRSDADPEALKQLCARLDDLRAAPAESLNSMR